MYLMRDVPLDAKPPLMAFEESALRACPILKANECGTVIADAVEVEK